jgi:Putative phage holin Dp-1
MTINAGLYNIMKSIALIWLPALTTAYFAIASIWGIPDTTNVIGTITAIDTFLGVALRLTPTPVDGHIEVNPQTSELTDLHLTDKTVSDIASQGVVTLQVHDTTKTSS